MGASKYWKIIKQAVAVISSAITDIEYDAKTKTMIITFKNGRIYEYENISPELHEDLIHAPSIGGFFNSNILGQTKYPFREML